MQKHLKSTLNKSEFKHIFNRYFDAIRSYIYYRITDEAMASDLAQDVFMKIWEKKDRLDQENIKALLYKMASDAVVSEFRKNAVRLNYAANMHPAEPCLSPQEEAEFEELKKNYSETLAGMPEAQRTAFLMNREEGLRYPEIAERLGISIKAVEKRMTRALKLLKTKLLSYGNEY